MYCSFHLRNERDTQFTVRSVCGTYLQLHLAKLSAIFRLRKESHYEILLWEVTLNSNFTSPNYVPASADGRGRTRRCSCGS